MRLKFLAKVFLMGFCSLIVVAAFVRMGYAAGEPCMAVPLLSPTLDTNGCITVPEAPAGIITYALGFLGAGIVALKSKFGR